MPPTFRACLALVPLLAGCAADAGAPLATRALAAVGLAPAAAAVPAPARVTIELHAAPSLNAARDGVAVPTRVQLHWLHDPTAFLQASYRRFDTASGDGVSEHVVLPGSRLDLVETAPREARALGLVVLFRSPAPGRWRYAFGLPETGPIRVSLHECAIAVAQGAVIGAGPDAARVGDTPCPPSP